MPDHFLKAIPGLYCNRTVAVFKPFSQLRTTQRYPITSPATINAHRIRTQTGIHQLANTSGENKHRHQSATHKAILASFFLTLTAAAIASHPKVTTLIYSYYKPGSLPGENNSLNILIKNFGINYINADGLFKSDLLSNFVARRGPSELNLAVNYFLQNTKSNEEKYLAIALAQAGGYRYGNTRLLLVAASEYISGKNIGKNLDFADYLLNMIKSENSSSDYYRGLIFMDKDNPNADTEKAKFYLGKASGAGLKPAKQALEKLESRSNQGL